LSGLPPLSCCFIACLQLPIHHPFLPLPSSSALFSLFTRLVSVHCFISLDCSSQSLLFSPFLVHFFVTLLVKP
jgi:hypothetical protein